MKKRNDCIKMKNKGTIKTGTVQHLLSHLNQSMNMVCSYFSFMMKQKLKPDDRKKNGGLIREGQKEKA